MTKGCYHIWELTDKNVSAHSLEPKCREDVLLDQYKCCVCGDTTCVNAGDIITNGQQEYERKTFEEAEEAFLEKLYKSFIEEQKKWIAQAEEMDNDSRRKG